MELFKIIPWLKKFKIRSQNFIQEKKIKFYLDLMQGCLKILKKKITIKIRNMLTLEQGKKKGGNRWS